MTPNLFLTIASIIALSILFADLSGIPDKISWWLAKKKIWYKTSDVSVSMTCSKRYPARIKPFDCSLCLSWWMTIIMLYRHGLPASQIIGLAAITAVTTYLISKGIDIFKRI